MNIKTLFAIAALTLGASAMAQTVVQEPDGSRNVLPGELTRESATLTGTDAGNGIFNFIFTQDGSKIPVGCYAEYPVSVAKAGKYVLYLTTGDKEKNGNGIGYKIYVDGTEQVDLKDPQNYGGNWNVFLSYPVELDLPAGDYNIKIEATSNRCNLSEVVNPVILEKDAVTVIDGVNDVAIDLPHQHISTPTHIWLTYSAFGADNSGFGPADHKSVLLTDIETNVATKYQSPFDGCKPRYLVEVAQSGSYTVNMVGSFTPGRYKDENKQFLFYYDLISGYAVNFTRVETGDESPTDLGYVEFPDVDIQQDGVLVEPLNSGNGLGGTTCDVTADGVVNLTAGTYYLELSATYGYEEYLSLKSLTFGAATTDGISTVASSVKAHAATFDLQGRSVAQPTKGVYVRNGKKIVVK